MLTKVSGHTWLNFNALDVIQSCKIQEMDQFGEHYGPITYWSYWAVYIGNGKFGTTGIFNWPSKILTPKVAKLIMDSANWVEVLPCEPFHPTLPQARQFVNLDFIVCASFENRVTSLRSRTGLSFSLIDNTDNRAKFERYLDA